MMSKPKFRVAIWCTEFREYVDATFTGSVVYRYLVSTEALRNEGIEAALKELAIFCGKDRFFVTYPIAQGTRIKVVVCICDPSVIGTCYQGHWVTNTTRDQVVDRFDDFEPDARTVIKLCDKPSKWAPLPFCVRKRVALIGDACHAMTPYLGAGAGQAIDVRFISHPLTTLSRIPDALWIYQEVRLLFAQTVASLSLSTGRMYMFMEHGYYDGTRNEEDMDDGSISAYERDGMETMKRELLRRWAWIDDSRSGIKTWTDAEEKLQVLAGQIAN